jgi:hypothetical protein
MRKRHFQFRLANWFWLTLVIASFFLGQNWDTVIRVLQPTASTTTRRLMFGTGVNSDLGVSGQLVADEAEFSVVQSGQE